MSAAHGAHDDGHDDQSHGHEDDAAGHSTFNGYMTGFLLSVILTAVPFFLVMTKTFESSQTTAFVIMGFAVVQIFVHMIYFLHMNTRSEGGWTLLALLFTLMLVIITLSGSLWVMYNLNSNMMPMSPHEARQMP
ncbi:cytochrome o ubiquinol oxidase subunit IV [soil metagenome]